MVEIGILAVVFEEIKDVVAAGAIAILDAWKIADEPAGLGFASFPVFFPQMG